MVGQTTVGEALVETYQRSNALVHVPFVSTVVLVASVH